MTAFVQQEDAVTHGLCSQLNCRNMVCLQNIQHFVIHAVGTRGNADSRKRIFKLLRRIQKRQHIPTVNRGKAAAEKCNFGIFCTDAQIRLRLSQSRPDVIRCRLIRLTRDVFLVAEAALMRAAVVRNKNRNVAVLNSPSAPMLPVPPAAPPLFCSCRRPCR